MGNSGRVIAGDLHPRKLGLIEEAAKRLGVTIVTTVPLDGTRPGQALGDRTFDRVLVDAPCSGLGVIRRNPEGKWWKDAADPGRLAETQRTILRAAAGHVRKGGVLLYSTCSTADIENENVVAEFLSDRPDFVVENLGSLFPEWGDLFTSAGFFRAWPHRQGMDGFFAARFRRQ
jgi:16S rRNA (cytosine967-C5)-methyltransferase